MRFSIIIPTYNEQEYIERCLQSIFLQEFDKKEFEVIVSDALSEDETVRLALSHSARVVNTTKRGIAHGRNIGAQNAKGEILLFVDADVTLTPDFLSRIDKAFQSPGTIAVTGKAIPVDGNAFARMVYRSTYLLVNVFHFFGMPLYPGLCVAYRAAAFGKLGGFREDFGVAEDLDLSKRISQLGTCRVDNSARAYVSTRRLQ
ncbi:MAG: glycosyltransferase, partial [Nitrososphaera sp.]|nr:glycosyltransferase [Nitrososphaera sp.]